MAIINFQGKFNSLNKAVICGVLLFLNQACKPVSRGIGSYCPAPGNGMEACDSLPLSA